LSSTTIKMGAPKAIVTTTADSRTQIIGPLSYAPQLPKLIDGDTIEVKMDVRHKLYQVANGVFFTAWVYGDSLPGPVLRIKLGQTVKFYMTDRSNDTLSIGMHMQPMPHSIDFHAAM